MKNLSYTQEFYLCSVNEKGKLKSDEIYAALLAGAVFELFENGFVAFKGDKKEWLVAAKPLHDDFAYLKPLYDFIASQKTPMERISVAAFTSNKQFDELRTKIGASLVALDCAVELPEKSEIWYAPKKDEVNRVIEKIRAELLENGNIADETLCLTIMLGESGIIHDYFSKVESEALKKRLEEVRNSDAWKMMNEIFSFAMLNGILWLV